MLTAASPTLTSRLAHLAASSRGTTESYLASARGVLQHVLSHPELVDPSAFPRVPSGYSRNLLYGRDGVSVWALIWSPGARTSIHDHHCTCCFGVLAGTIRENWFRPIEGDRAVRTAHHVRTPGFVACMAPTGPNIHQMVNDGDAEAISLHIYGYDHEAHASSVDREYSLATL